MQTHQYEEESTYRAPLATYIRLYSLLLEMLRTINFYMFCFGVQRSLTPGARSWEVVLTPTASLR